MKNSKNINKFPNVFFIHKGDKDFFEKIMGILKGRSFLRCSLIMEDVMNQIKEDSIFPKD